MRRNRLTNEDRRIGPGSFLDTYGKIYAGILEALCSLP
jgi:hypothetical protein